MTLHRRFPYAVLAGFFFLDAEAAHDGSERRSSTFANAHHRLALFTGRPDPDGREEQYERLLDARPSGSRVSLYEAGRPDEPIPFGQIVQDLLELVARRNPDFFEFRDGRIVRA